MAAALERSFIEICGFERETLHRFREVTVNLGKRPHRLLTALFSVFFDFHKFVSTRGLNVFTTAASTASTLLSNVSCVTLA